MPDVVDPGQIVFRLPDTTFGNPKFCTAGPIAEIKR
jgi:hypothetical protein